MGVSSKNADLDNTIKQLQDIVTKFFKINDKRIYKIEAEKFDVKKGQEFIDFDIVDYEQTSCTPL